MTSTSSQTSSRVGDTVQSSEDGTPPNNNLRHDKERASFAHTATRRAGRKSEYWSTEQLALIGKHTTRFLACVEEHKDDLLGKSDRRSWPKPLLLCLEVIQNALFADEKMRTNLHEGMRKATGERPLSREDLDHNTAQEEKNKDVWKQKVKDFFKNKLRDYRKEHSSEGTKPAKNDQSAYELLQKVLFASFGPRDLFAQENADEIRKCRDELVAQKPELQSNNGAPYQMAISKLWAAADQASYIARAKDQFMNLDRDEEKLSRALHWFLNALSPKLGEVEMKLVYALRHTRGGISVRSVDAACKSRTNFDDKFETDHEESWESFSNAFMQWADKRIPQHVPQGPKTKTVWDIPENSEGVPVFPNETSSDDIAVMRDILNAYLRALWFYSWPADPQMAAIPWSEVAEHPEDYYDLDQLPKGDKLQSPDSMKRANLVNWFEYFEERPRNIPPFRFFPKSKIQGRLRRRQMQASEELHAGEEFADDESAPRSSSPALEIATSLETEDHVPMATSSESVTPCGNNNLIKPSESTSTSISMDDIEGATTILPSPLSSSASPDNETRVSRAATINSAQLISPAGNDTEDPAPFVAASASSFEVANSGTTAVSVPTGQSSLTSTVDDAAMSAVASPPFSSTPHSRTTAGSNATEEDSLPPVASQQTIQKHISQSSLTIKVPPLSKGPNHMQGATVGTSMEDVEDQAVGEKEAMGKGRKGKGRVKKSSDRSRKGEVGTAEAGGSRRKRKVDSVEEAEVQGDQKRVQTAGISTVDIETVAQRGQRRSNRIKNAQKPLPA
ncbi:hypothetical protein VKT23_012344 [Stygiomarasmius scandens]|uniref:Uncharacterized protein n=1 Tax=Marasmiellus scandens TaxID=2682957 RepID=A0ABR1J9V7_9AGAR